MTRASIQPLDNPDLLDEGIPVNEEDEVNKQERKRANRQLKRNRIIFSVLMSGAFLLGCWAVVEWTFRIFPRPIGPSPELAKEALNIMRVEPSMTGQVWQQCIRDESRLCAAELDEARDAEESRINSIHASNQVKLDEASKMQTTCALKYSEGETLFRDLVLAGDTLPFNLDDNVCPLEDREEILERAGADVRKGQEEIIGIMARMNEENRHQLVTIETFLQDYERYHREYFFGRLRDLEASLILDIGTLTIDFNIPLPPELEALINCVSHAEGTIPCPFTPISVSLDEVRNTARAINSVSREQLQLAAMVIATLVDRYDWAVGTIQDLARIFRSIRSVLGRPFDLAWDSLGGGIDLNSFDNLFPGLYYVSGDLDFPELPDVPPIDHILAEFKEEIEKVKEATREIAAQVSEELQEKVDELVAKVRQAFDGVLEDYNPPQLSFDSDFGDITGPFDVRNQAFRARFEAAVNSLKVTRNRLPEADTQLPPASLGEWEEVRDGVEDAAPTLLDFQVPTIPELIWMFYEWLSQNYGIIDLAFRGWVVIQRCLRFAHEAEVPVPKIIVGSPGTDREEQEAEQEKQKRSWIKKVLDIAFSKTWVKVFLAVAVFFSFGFFLLVIRKYHGHYHARCVETETGTALSQGLVLPIIHNTAKLDGEVALRQERLKLAGQRNLACTALIASSTVVHRQQEENLFLTKHEYNKTMAETSKILDCIDLNAIGGEGPQLNTDLSTCAVPLDVDLDNGVARCWDKCEVDCNEGKITQEITRIVIQKSCVYEWFVLSEMVLLFLKLLQYWCFAISLVLFEWAMIILFRTYFRRDSVKWVYEEDCESGEIIGAEGLSLEEAKAEAASKYFRTEKMKAFCQIALFFVFNGVWIYARIHVARSDDWLRPKWFVEE